uniref:Uncharacterized protein n=1 Tax=Arundo donax TaxID=35708 RepID=A0A0A9BME7_ARUDO
MPRPMATGTRRATERPSLTSMRPPLQGRLAAMRRRRRPSPRRRSRTDDVGCYCHELARSLSFLSMVYLWMLGMCAQF